MTAVLAQPIKGMSKIKKETKALVKGMKGLVTKQTRQLQIQNRIAEDNKYDNVSQKSSFVINNDDGSSYDPYLKNKDPLKLKNELEQDADDQDDHKLSQRVCDKMNAMMMKMQGKWQVNEVKQIYFEDQRFDRRINKHQK